MQKIFKIIITLAALFCLTSKSFAGSDEWPRPSRGEVKAMSAFAEDVASEHAARSLKIKEFVDSMIWGLLAGTLIAASEKNEEKQMKVLHTSIALSLIAAALKYEADEANVPAVEK